MSAPQPGQIEETELYVGMLISRAPHRSLLDIRYRAQKGGFARLFLYTSDKTAPRRIANIGQHTDIYVGCAPRVRPRGTRADIADTALLWVDCDDETSLRAVRAFTPRASMIVASGTPGHAHAYWQIGEALDAGNLHDANWRLAKKLGADMKCADPTRILRPPGTWNHKHRRYMPVEILQHTGARHPVADILTQLPALDRPLGGPPRPMRRRSHEHDPLQQINPADYTQHLTGQIPNSEGKIACPFHPDDKPSLHTYPTPEQGWACYGCKTPDGKPLGGDIYTFASRLWKIPAHGHSFLELQARLDARFGVRRDQVARSIDTAPQLGEADRRTLAEQTHYDIER